MVAEFGMSDEDMHARAELMATVTPTNIVGDAEALLAAADADPAATTTPRATPPKSHALIIK